MVDLNLPTPGGDDNAWGPLLNLAVEAVNTDLERVDGEVETLPRTVLGQAPVAGDVDLYAAADAPEQRIDRNGRTSGMLEEISGRLRLVEPAGGTTATAGGAGAPLEEVYLSSFPGWNSTDKATYQLAFTQAMAACRSWSGTPYEKTRTLVIGPHPSLYEYDLGGLTINYHPGFSWRGVSPRTTEFELGSNKDHLLVAMRRQGPFFDNVPGTEIRNVAIQNLMFRGDYNTAVWMGTQSVLRDSLFHNLSFKGYLTVLLGPISRVQWTGGGYFQSCRGVQMDVGGSDNFFDLGSGFLQMDPLPSNVWSFKLSLNHSYFRTPYITPCASGTVRIVSKMEGLRLHVFMNGLNRKEPHILATTVGALPSASSAGRGVLARITGSSPNTVYRSNGSNWDLFADGTTSSGNWPLPDLSNSGTNISVGHQRQVTDMSESDGNWFRAHDYNGDGVADTWVGPNFRGSHAYYDGADGPALQIDPGVRGVPSELKVWSRNAGQYSQPGIEGVVFLGSGVASGSPIVVESTVASLPAGRRSSKVSSGSRLVLDERVDLKFGTPNNQSDGSGVTVLRNV